MLQEPLKAYHEAWKAYWAYQEAWGQRWQAAWKAARSARNDVEGDAVPIREVWTRYRAANKEARKVCLEVEAAWRKAWEAANKEDLGLRRTM